MAKGGKPKTNTRAGAQFLPRVGFHAPIKDGLENALFKSREFGCDTLQMFSRNPRGWKAKELSLDAIIRFRNARKETRISPVVIHTNYLINLAALDKELLEKSVASFREEVERAILLGADYVVVHPGNARGSCEPDAFSTVAESLRAACQGLPMDGVRILLENTAGQGGCIGYRFEHLRAIMDSCPELKLGVCLDTAHAFTSGYDIREEDGLEATLAWLNKTVKLRNVRAVHFNDSKAPYNSRVDRHWHIGEGHIGKIALQRVVRSPHLRHAAFLLETPQDEPGDDERNVRTLQSYRSKAN